MLNPIKRVFVPKPQAAAPVAAAAQPSPPKATKPIPVLDELPSPDMVEKDSDSVWAEFDSVRPQHTARK